jgi:hypothetical protein
MARTIEQIKAEIIAQKNNDTNLSGLNSPSQSAIWLLWVNIFAFAHFLLESLFDIFKEEVNQTIAQRRLGTPSWYVQSALEFQQGDTLNAFGKYELIDDTKKIVKKASFKESSNGELTLKVAKQGSQLEPLDSGELLQFKNYVDEIKFAGTRINIVSLNADILNFNAQIYYEGLYAENTIKQNIINAINEYLLNLAFDGTISKADLIAKIRNVQGIKEVNFLALNVVNGINATSLDLRLELQAGYCVFSEAQSNFTFFAE